MGFKYFIYIQDIIRDIKGDFMAVGAKDFIDKLLVEKYAKEYAAREKIVSVKNLMENMKFTLEQALNALGIQGDERELILRQLQK